MLIQNSFDFSYFFEGPKYSYIEGTWETFQNNFREVRIFYAAINFKRHIWESLKWWSMSHVLSTFAAYKSLELFLPGRAILRKYNRRYAYVSIRKLIMNTYFNVVNSSWSHSIMFMIQNTIYLIIAANLFGCGRCSNTLGRHQFEFFSKINYSNLVCDIRVRTLRIIVGR